MSNPPRQDSDQSFASPQPKLLDGRKGLILGVANHRSIAWAVAEQLKYWGADVALSVLDDFELVRNFLKF